MKILLRTMIGFVFVFIVACVVTFFYWGASVPVYLGNIGTWSLSFLVAVIITTLLVSYAIGSSIFKD